MKLTEEILDDVLSSHEWRGHGGLEAGTVYGDLAIEVADKAIAMVVLEMRKRADLLVSRGEWNAYAGGCISSLADEIERVE